MKTNNITIKERKTTKGWNRLLGNSWRGCKPHPDVLKDLAKKMREWAIKDKSLRLDDFLDEECVPTSTYYNWKDECDELKESHEFALRRLASRREKLAFFKQADRDIFLRTQHMYDSKWDKEVNQYHKSLKMDEELGSVGQTHFILVHSNMNYESEGGFKYISKNLTPEGKGWLKQKGYDKEIGEPEPNKVNEFY